MLLWILIALLTAAAILAVLLPLGRRPATSDPAAHMARVYRDQLAELERDKAEGSMSPADAEAARAEIARRLIATETPAAMESPEPRLLLRRGVALLALVGIPLISLSLYLALGTPNMPGMPLAERLAHPGSDIETLVAQVEMHLAAAPEDGRGWEVIAPVYFSLGRADDAARAYRNAIRLLGSTAERETGLGGAILAAEEGIVTADAHAAFEAASKLDPTAPEPRYFLGLAAQQEGKTEEATKIWQLLLADTPSDAPWRPMLEQALAGAGSPPAPSPTASPGEAVASTLPGPTGEDVAAAQNLPAGDQAAMIDGMVTRLAARLKDEPNDVEGWLRLIRSYVVLGRTDEAAKAAKTALGALPDPETRGRVEALIADLGVTPAGAATP